MFGPPGNWYIYLCYGIHWMANIVTGEPGFPAAVLLRGVEGHDGPGKLTKAIGIDRRYNMRPATPASGLWFAYSGGTIPVETLTTSPRVGIGYAGEPWTSMPWRWLNRPATTAKAKARRTKAGQGKELGQRKPRVPRR